LNIINNYYIIAILILKEIVMPNASFCCAITEKIIFNTPYLNPKPESSRITIIGLAVLKTISLMLSLAVGCPFGVLYNGAKIIQTKNPDYLFETGIDLVTSIVSIGLLCIAIKCALLISGLFLVASPTAIPTAILGVIGLGLSMGPFYAIQNKTCTDFICKILGAP
jgi:hypothetical protein